MAINRGKQLGLLAGLGVGASLLLADAGKGARKRARAKTEKIPDTNHTLAARVCAELDEKIVHGKGIQVFADDNLVTLRGDALRYELDDVLDAVNSISSVRGVENLLDVRETPGKVLALQN